MVARADSEGLGRPVTAYAGARRAVAASRVKVRVIRGARGWLLGPASQVGDGSLDGELAPEFCEGGDEGPASRPVGAVPMASCRPFRLAPRWVRRLDGGPRGGVGRPSKGRGYDEGVALVELSASLVEVLTGGGYAGVADGGGCSMTPRAPP